MITLLMIYLGFLLIKAVLVMLPGIIRNTMFQVIPRRRYTAEEVIRCGHMRPDLYYKKQLLEEEALTATKKCRFKSKKLQYKEIIALESPIDLNANTYKEVDVDIIRERFKRKMKHRELTRSQILAIKDYLSTIIDCKEKKFDNDCHCIYYCLKQLDKEQILDLTALANLLK